MFLENPATKSNVAAHPEKVLAKSLSFLKPQ